MIIGPLKTRTDGLVAYMVNGRESTVFWDDITPMAQEVMDSSDNELSVEDLLAEIASARITLWLLFDEEKTIRAFTTTQPMTTQKGLWVDLPFTYTKNDLAAGPTLWQVVEEWAEDNGYYGLKFISADPRMSSWAKRRKMKQRFVEYVKEF